MLGFTSVPCGKQATTQPTLIDFIISNHPNLILVLGATVNQALDITQVACSYPKGSQARSPAAHLTTFKPIKDFLIVIIIIIINW